MSLPSVSISMIMSSVWIISPPASDSDSSVLDVLGNLCRAKIRTVKCKNSFWLNKMKIKAIRNTFVSLNCQSEALFYWWVKINQCTSFLYLKSSELSLFTTCKNTKWHDLTATALEINKTKKKNWISTTLWSLLLLI